MKKRIQRLELNRETLLRLDAIAGGIPQIPQVTTGVGVCDAGTAQESGGAYSCPYACTNTTCYTSYACEAPHTCDC